MEVASLGQFFILHIIDPPERTFNFQYSIDNIHSKYRDPMKTTILRNCLSGTLTILLVLFAGTATYARQGGVIQTYKNATAPFDDTKLVDGVLPLRIKPSR